MSDQPLSLPQQLAAQQKKHKPRDRTICRRCRASLNDASWRPGDLVRFHFPFAFWLAVQRMSAEARIDPSAMIEEMLEVAVVERYEAIFEQRIGDITPRRSPSTRCLVDLGDAPYPDPSKGVF